MTNCTKFANLRYLLLGIFFMIIAFAGTVYTVVFAQEADKLKEKINKQQQEIERLDEEIAKYERELSSIGKKKKTLQNSVRQLDLSRNKVSASIERTKKQINILSDEIKDISQEIKEKEKLIETNKKAISKAIREINEYGSNTFIEILLRGDSLGGVWNDIEALQSFQETVQVKVEELSEHKTVLQDSVKKAQLKEKELSKQKNSLTVQKKSLDINRREKNALLSKTKNKESNYQALLTKKRKVREEFEKELSEYESKLRYVLDPSAIPPVGKGVLRWPLSRIRITQYFGNTKFARSGAYNGQGHNGVDFGIPLGTPVKAAASGVVQAIGNTDAYPGCLSYGKWILLRHYNGLSTLYAHTSQVVRAPGEKVSAGDVIAYSGSSGFSTGPHLHLTLYASNGVRVVRIGDIRKTRNCKNARIPVAPWKAYLNPLDYL